MKKVLFIVLSMFIGSSQAIIAPFGAKIVRVLHMPNELFGTCMAQFDTDPSIAGLDCPVWGTFSCSGELSSKDTAYRLYDMAQMAFALDKPVLVWLNDQKKHNGYCFVERLDVLQ